MALQEFLVATSSGAHVPEPLRHNMAQAQHQIRPLGVLLAQRGDAALVDAGQLAPGPGQEEVLLQHPEGGHIGGLHREVLQQPLDMRVADGLGRAQLHPGLFGSRPLALKPFEGPKLQFFQRLRKGSAASCA